MYGHTWLMKHCRIIITHCLIRRSTVYVSFYVLHLGMLIFNWKLNFEWGKIDMSVLTGDELHFYVEKTVNAAALFAGVVSKEVDNGVNENSMK